MTLPVGKCVWGCGRSNFDREHIIGRNVAKHMEVGYPVPVHLGDSPQGGTETIIEGRVCEA